MRLVGCFLVLALAGSAAFAEEAHPVAPAPPEAEPGKPKVPLRVVKMLPDTHQALLFDQSRGTHVLVEVGTTVEGFKVDGIADDELTLAAASGAEIVLAAPDRVTPAVAPKVAEPVDPYADPIRVVEAPHDDGVRSVEAPTPATPTPASPLGGAPPVPTGAAPVAPAPAAPAPASPAPAAPDAPTVLSRADVTASLADFGKLAGAIRGQFIPAGIRIDVVTPTSLFAKAGLRPGDVVTTVDNQPFQSLDDAASLYARAKTTRNVTVQVVRGGNPMTLRIAIQ